ncbi:MAG: beta-L-arabinofuranosidase domain-containing protein [Thermoguttaceae bacterium]
MKACWIAMGVAGLIGLGQATAAPPSEALSPVYFQRIELDGFWKDQVKRLTENWIPHCIAQMEEGGEGRELLNLVNTAKVLRGEPCGKFTGAPWSDAYVYNTLEASSLALTVDPQGDPELAAAQDLLRQKIDEWIPIVLAAQMEDGYIHSFHVVNKLPRYSNINNHEFYVQGYLLEAGVAHYRMTGGKDRRLYDAARRCADQLCNTFGPAPKRNWIYGHPGMEIALCRMARLVNEVEGRPAGNKYSDLAKFFLDHRHEIEEHRSAYRQSHLPVVEQFEAVGHAVRATYFFLGIADLAMLTGDGAYESAVDKIWASAVDRRMYVTGGVGSTGQGEAFGDDYRLPNESAYCESCAGCGLSFWADRMNRLHAIATPVDIQERVLYNNILGAVELSGKNFYYQNPLASGGARYSWHGCPCCVGNIPRALIAIKDSMYALNPQKDVLVVNHYLATSGTIAGVAGVRVALRQETEYPWKGDISLTLQPEKAVAFTVKLRIPNHGESALYKPTPAGGEFELRVNGEVQSAVSDGGYVSLSRTWQPGDCIQLVLAMPIQRIYADRRLQVDRGRVALQRGPLVYNVESVDHEGEVRSIVLARDAELSAVWKEDLLGGVMVLEGQATRSTPDGAVPVSLVAVPNYARLNRGGWSQVWIAEDPALAARRLEAEPGVYRVAAMHTGKPWGVAEGSTEAGAIVQQQAPGDAKSQQWRIEKVSPACYKIVNVHSGLALTVADGSRNNNALLSQAPYEGKDYQQFALETREGDVTVMIARHSGRCVCVQVSSRKDGAPIHQYDYVGVADQQIKLTKVE